MDAYEILDLSAHGPNRGLLVAVESIHPLQPAPPLHHVVTRDWPASDALTADVLAALQKEAYQRMPALVAQTRHSKESIRCALKRLIKEGRVEGRQADQGNAFRQVRMEWRRTR